MKDTNEVNVKYCKRCDTEKQVSEFYTSKTQCGGYSSMCKSCDKERKMKKYRTKDGLVSSIYSGQRNRNTVLYTKEELRDWLFSQHLFHELYNNWKVSDYNKNIAPSVDRINPLGIYSFENIQLMTWIDNKGKGYSDRMLGIDTRNLTSVYCICSESGEKLGLYKSIMIASRELGIPRENIKNSLLRNGIEGKKRIWKYA